MPIPRFFFISGVAASVSEWQLIHSITLAATIRSSRSSPTAAEGIDWVHGLALFAMSAMCRMVS
jgi:hypothetical protein